MPVTLTDAVNSAKPAGSILERGWCGLSSIRSSDISAGRLGEILAAEGLAALGPEASSGLVDGSRDFVGVGPEFISADSPRPRRGLELLDIGKFLTEADVLRGTSLPDTRGPVKRNEMFHVEHASYNTKIFGRSRPYRFTSDILMNC